MKPEESIDKIWQQYVIGEKELFKVLYLHYYPELYSYGKTITHRTELIDGAIQDLFLRLWEKAPQGVKSIDNYIFRSFRNQLSRQLKTGNWYTPIDIEANTIQPGIHHSTEEEMIRSESKSKMNTRIHNALESLPARRKEAIYLKFFQNKSTREISIIMNIREEMVRNYIHKGIKTLRKNYSERLYLLYSMKDLLLFILASQILSAYQYF